MKDYEILTIGYEGREIDEFLSCLKDRKVTRLVDVREVPLSRKKGFSKSALKERLEEENIEYVHLRSLGSPSEMRQKLKQEWDYDTFFNAYLRHLSQNEEAVLELYRYIVEGVTCIMCFERLPQKCHRSAVADTIKKYGRNRLRVTHI